MPDLKILAPLFLAAQALLIHWMAGRERPPAPPDLERFSLGAGSWKQFREDPIAADVQAELRADRLFDRGYFDPATGIQADLFVAWFQSQNMGRRQPHSPQVCLPGSGWTPESTGEISIETAAGTISATRYVVAKGVARSVVLYWYQTPRRAIAGEWAAKLWLVADAIRDHRTDTALVRIIVPYTNGAQPEAASHAATAFARELYPVLRNYLPQ